MCIYLCFDVSKSAVTKVIRDGRNPPKKLSAPIQRGRIEEILEPHKNRRFLKAWRNKPLGATHD